MSGKVISIHDAKLKTVNVGIKTVTISDRQVTLSLFKQLVSSELISDSGKLNGLPWGWVNYHPDKYCKHIEYHKHFIWQKGEELRRSRVIMDIRYYEAHGLGRFFFDTDESARKRIEETLAELETLPQLFIAG